MTWPENWSTSAPKQDVARRKARLKRIRFTGRVVLQSGGRNRGASRGRYLKTVSRHHPKKPLRLAVEREQIPQVIGKVGERCNATEALDRIIVRPRQANLKEFGAVTYTRSDWPFSISAVIVGHGNGAAEYAALQVGTSTNPLKITVEKRALDDDSLSKFSSYTWKRRRPR
jgi:hypothetical protein